MYTYIKLKKKGNRATKEIKMARKVTRLTFEQKQKSIAKKKVKRITQARKTKRGEWQR